MKNHEILILNYIDGLCSADECKLVEHKLATDQGFNKLYQELLAVDSLIHDQLDLEEPSMSFTRKTLERTTLAAKPVSLTTKIDNTIIVALSSIFLLLITALIAYSIATIDYSKSDLKWLLFEDIALYNLFENTTALYVFLLVDTVLLLIYLDKWMRRKLNSVL